MWCMRCNHELYECTCEDLQERLQSIPGSSFVYRKCSTCQNHYAKCKCESPVWVYSNTGLPFEEEIG